MSYPRRLFQFVFSPAAAFLFPVSLYAADPVATAAATPAPTATPAAPQAPVLPPVSPFFVWSSMELFTESKRVESGWPKSGRTEMSSLDFGEQTLMPPLNSGALSGDEWIFQKRFSPFASYLLMKKSTADQDLTMINSMRGSNLIVDTATYCPKSRQVLMLGYGIDASGKALVNGKPRRLYLVDQETGRSELVWKLNKDDRGGFAHAVSATPDCKHILANLNLETEGQRTPYGKIVYLKGEPDKWGVYPETLVQEIKPGGGSKRFSNAVFVLPPTANVYLPQKTPPIVVATREYIETVAQRYRIDVLTPNGKGSSWARRQIDVPAEVKRLDPPMFYNRTNAFLVLFEKVPGAGGAVQTGIASVALEDSSTPWQVAFVGGPIRLMWASLHPSGDRLVASYVPSDKSIEKWAKPFPAAGVVEVLAGVGGKDASFANIEPMSPFHAIPSHHNPRPQYGSDGKRLFFTVPAITDLADAKLFEPDAKVDAGLQFHTTLIEWKMGGDR